MIYTKTKSYNIEIEYFPHIHNSNAHIFIIKQNNNKKVKKNNKLASFILKYWLNNENIL